MRVPYDKKANRITLTGTELGVHADIRSLRAAAKQHAIAEGWLTGGKNPPVVVTNKHRNMQVAISPSGVKHVLTAGSDRTKLKLIAAIPQMLENSRYIGWRPDYRGRRDFKAHKFRIEVDMDGQRYAVEIVARQQKGSDILFYDHNYIKATPIRRLRK